MCSFQGTHPVHNRHLASQGVDFRGCRIHVSSAVIETTQRLPKWPSSLASCPLRAPVLTKCHPQGHSQLNRACLSAFV